MEHNAKRRFRLSKISLIHYIKLVFRSGLFLLVLGNYLFNRSGEPVLELIRRPDRSILLQLIWLIFMVEMLLRFIPSRWESMGSQKQFSRNYRPRKGGTVRLPTPLTMLAVIAAWTALNGAIGALYFSGIIDEGILLLVCLAYAVCDMICILFFCPFQTWFLKNRCCASCRIYNWDYAMMFTPLLFIPTMYTWTLLGFALLLLIRWEIAVHTHPERFSVTTNASLACANCPEKLCQHIKQLKNWLKTRQNFDVF